MRRQPCRREAAVDLHGRILGVARVERARAPQDAASFARREKSVTLGADRYF
jgi:hypothetical protein